MTRILNIGLADVFVKIVNPNYYGKEGIQKRNMPYPLVGIDLKLEMNMLTIEFRCLIMELMLILLNKLLNIKELCFLEKI